MTQPPDISGGGGFTFADAAAALYLNALLGQELAPGLENRGVRYVALERANFGEPLDDLVADGLAPDGSAARVSLQLKRELTISDAVRNADFREIVHAAWATLAKADFRENIDRVGVVTGTISEGARRAFLEVCEWARSSLTSDSFYARFQPGAAGKQHREVLDAVRSLLGEVPGDAVGDAGVYRLLRHFVLIKVDVLHAGATDDLNTIERLRLRLEDPAQAELLWHRLRTIARDAAGRAGEFDREALLAALGGAFKFKPGGGVAGETVISADDEKTIASVPDVADGSEVGSRARLEESTLRQIAEDLLRVGSPPSLLPLFPGASNAARQALEKFGRIRRTVSAVDRGTSEKQKAMEIAELTATDELQHLLLAPPGSGKTHALWHAARQMLDGGGLIPLFLSLGRLAGWDDAIRALADVTGDIDVGVLLRDPRVCVFLDGWSEFASGYGADQRARALRVLSRTRVVADGRRGMAVDAVFRLWALEPPAVSAVEQAVRTAFPDSAPPGPALIELLRLPLALSLFILLGGLASTRGELLTRLHDHLSHDLPDAFREAVAGAVASVILRRQGRSYTRLENELRQRAAQASLAEPIKLLQKLGTLEDRAGTVLPVHDLYWSWLGGLGLLAEDKIAASVTHIGTRECYELALESGVVPRAAMVTAAIETDITLAALLSSYLGGDHRAEEAFSAAVKALFADAHLPVRCRAAVAAFRSGRADLLRAALNVLTETHDAKLYVPAFEAALAPTTLFPNRGIIADWLGATGTEQLTDAIAARGDAEWGPWLQQMALSGKISMPVAVAATLACDGGLPEWTIEHLPAAVSSQSWKFRAVADRGINAAFADWLAEHYEECTGTTQDAAWFHLNRVLVSCGTEATFERLLARFLKMPDKAQETIGFAVVDRGEPWIARFQAKAFASGGAQRHHKIAEVVSMGIDDDTARRWIADGPTELGWRVLAARYGAGVIPEMLANLPASLGEVHVFPPLAAMRFLNDAPASLGDELMKRLTGRMQPKAMEDVINALARVHPTGVPSIISLITAQPLGMPMYFVGRALALLRDWEKENNVKIRVRSGFGDLSFAEWLLSMRMAQDRNDVLYRRAVAGDRDLAVKLVLGPLRDDESAVKEIIGQVQPLTNYHSELYELLIANPNLANLALKVFSGGFDTFPEASLLRAMDAPGIKFDDLLRALATASSPSHLAVHKLLITKLLTLPLDLFGYREMAKIVRVHPTPELVEILKSAMLTMTANEIWLVREIEAARGELLINERGAWLS